MGRPQIDQQARFEVLYRRHHLAVSNYARRRAGPASDDVVAEVFTAAWRHRERLTEIDLPWLIRAAHNVILHHHRSAGRQERLSNRLAQAPPHGVDDPADRVAGDLDNSAAVATAMTALSESDQELLRLVAWEQLTPREIAAVLGCTPGAARVRIHRASRRLALQLARSSIVTAIEPLGSVR